MNGILEGKVALITGAGSGIAAAAARLFHREGARIVLADVSGKEAELAAELGERAVDCRADVSKSDDVQAMIDMAITEFGQLDILCNVAGITGPQGSLEDAHEEDFDRVIAVNIRGLLLTTKYALPHLVAGNGGAIVNISSATALVGMPGLAVYSATKGAIIATTRVIAAEYASKGVRANVICPGGIETPIYLEHLARDPESVSKTVSLIPAGRVGKPEEIAQAMLFLASDASSYMTGAVVPVDGGQTAV
ncbi:NAD(P)-dependent dehydrogenase, short-chain alcohol dehydrogenase family [Rhizobium mongolense subsp. loessense]|uniref:NAD(P)-dependent dehydrogenase, short-chain alcohol dehydrogenase family n=1 Tax=Rhizobium mongolense subsp. loessense TaxID=158890 RepID=A0A1G4TQ08_9HYPH|nr:MULTISPECIES: SDR family oxidoreductase [Rhizobium/Agrobacterium group]NRP90597.1 2-(R)-hydroxypropyl-CoM dehydrogenase [Ensifer adhaerens]NSY52120.1 SDR family oxidoreductase [Agrobacterium tumefaciens]NTD87574.1 SDR family oxidoreductase [Agrobacterium tumefaciens]NTD92645.1 SDR family oxidoreductase [Agrobacterium tumefaciens]NTD97069.1 SDR family oxidoreductase [Agrobacterium tumefaciens]